MGRDPTPRYLRRVCSPADFNVMKMVPIMRLIYSFVIAIDRMNVCSLSCSHTWSSTIDWHSPLALQILFWVRLKRRKQLLRGASDSGMTVCVMVLRLGIVVIWILIPKQLGIARCPRTTWWRRAPCPVAMLRLMSYIVSETSMHTLRIFHYFIISIIKTYLMSIKLNCSPNFPHRRRCLTLFQAIKAYIEARFRSQ